MFKRWVLFFSIILLSTIFCGAQHIPEAEEPVCVTGYKNNDLVMEDFDIQKIIAANKQSIPRSGLK